MCSVTNITLYVRCIVFIELTVPMLYQVFVLAVHVQSSNATSTLDTNRRTDVSRVHLLPAVLAYVHTSPSYLTSHSRPTVCNI
jgi:hypothetical protein